MSARLQPIRPRSWTSWFAPALALLTLAPAAAAQLADTMEPDPDMPVKEGFDTDRALLFEAANFVPLRDPEWQPLRGTLRSGDLEEDTPVLVLRVAGKTLVLVSSQMSYHHVAQGEMEGEPWMITFWVVCNSGVRMAPRIDDEVHTFSEHGLYDGLFLLMDQETGTFWDHMTGDAVYGPLVGTTLEVSNLRMTTAGQILGEEPDALVTLSDRRLRSDEQMEVGSLLSRVGRGLNNMFSSTVKEEDDRLPTMDLGLGIWDGDMARYYSYDDVAESGRAILDRFQGRTLLVYLDPTAHALASFYVDADGFEWDEGILRLSNGVYVERGVVHESSGERDRPDRPLQVFTRWYGFSLTFPQTEIYGEGG